MFLYKNQDKKKKSVKIHINILKVYLKTISQQKVH